MDEDSTWYGIRPRRRPRCIRRVPSAPRKGHSTTPSFRPMSIVATVAHLSYCWALVILVLVFFIAKWPAEWQLLYSLVITKRKKCTLNCVDLFIDILTSSSTDTYESLIYNISPKCNARLCQLPAAVSVSRCNANISHSSVVKTNYCSVWGKFCAPDSAAFCCACEFHRRQKKNPRTPLTQGLSAGPKPTVPTVLHVLCLIAVMKRLQMAISLAAWRLKYRKEFCELLYWTCVLTKTKEF